MGCSSMAGIPTVLLAGWDWLPCITSQPLTLSLTPASNSLSVCLLLNCSGQAGPDQGGQAQGNH